MRKTWALAVVVALVVAGSGCIWFHERKVTVHVQNDLTRVVYVEVTMDRIGVFGNSIQQIYNRTQPIAGQGAHDLVISKVGNGNHALRLAYRNSAGATMEKTIFLLYEESPEDDPTDVQVRIRSETDFDMEAAGRGS